MCGSFLNTFQLTDQLLFQLAGRPELKGLPHFILGQSMGGAVTLKIHLKEPKLWDGVVLVAPMCKVSSNISATEKVFDLVIACTDLWIVISMLFKIADDVKPPEPMLKVLNLMSNVVPKAKLLPKVDLGELALREMKKRKLVRMPYILHLEFHYQWSLCAFSYLSIHLWLERICLTSPS